MRLLGVLVFQPFPAIFVHRRAGLRAGRPEATLQVIRATGLDQQLAVQARHLSHGMKQALELAMVPFGNFWMVV